jgi:hypothetical protein
MTETKNETPAPKNRTNLLIGALALGCLFMGAMLFMNKKPEPQPLTPVEQKMQDLQNKRKALNDKEQIAEMDAEIKQLEAALKGQPQPTPKPEDPYRGDAQVVGTNVTMRATPSTEGKKLGYFEPNESVTVIEWKESETVLEGKLGDDTPFFDTYKGSDDPKAVKLRMPVGTKVMIDRIDYAQKLYDVSYKHGDLGKVFTSIPFGSIELTNSKAWYRVQRKTGETPWVFGKFLSGYND